MMRSVLAMADALNLRVVCEGVETEHQFDILRSLGCEEAQGYLLGRPESPELALRRAIESQGLSLIKTTASAERAGVLVSARNTQA
jgi:EAL domain-containing protein (putative c-di-GMP-specific phosphodiesterase class I)